MTGWPLGALIVILLASGLLGGGLGVLAWLSRHIGEAEL